MGNFKKAHGQAAKADSITARRNYWGSIGFGPSSLGFAGLNLDVNAQISKHWVVSAEFQGELQSFRLSNDPSAELNTFNVFAGNIFKQRSSFITVSAGLGLADYYSSSSSDVFAPAATFHDQYAINVPITAQIYFVPVTPFAVSIGAYVNLNKLKTTAGITGKFAFGRMSTHNTRRPPLLPMPPPWLPGPKN